MANWIDFLSLVLTLGIVGGVIYGILYISRQVRESVEGYKESLKDKGVSISKKGVSVKTSKRFDREDYIDATQRNFVKAVSAAKFGHGETNGVTSTAMHRTASSISSNSSGDEKKKLSSLFRSKDKH
ncbi:hypothetical protein H0H81_009831 [Sphagnurus paluster]|uniref:Uncharacterized protein n=1 Tax=Sphagnurus paluster TaxID=117069 RepID=A0A9P7FPP7_9AGAR|nr:hypothetical protein H0H81_009831 [Sphagnurus paluster]